MMLVPACKEKKTQAPEIITTTYVPKRPQAPIAMPVDIQTTPVQWLGRTYTVGIERVAADSLPMVENDWGQKFIDNRITLTITREDGSVFFKKMFTKAAFAPYIDETYRKNALLSSMIFHETDDKELEFAVSVSMPESDDEFIPLELSVNNMREIKIERDSSIDTYGDSSDD
jgi:hypothetical protein